jgi:hypothetical protein
MNEHVLAIPLKGIQHMTIKSESYWAQGLLVGFILDCALFYGGKRISDTLHGSH